MLLAHYVIILQVCDTLVNYKENEIWFDNLFFNRQNGLQFLISYTQQL